MKNRLFILIFISMLCQSCLYKDLGNYDYKNINEVKVTGIINDRYIYKVFGIDHYNLSPKIEFTQNQDESNYEYKWIAYPRAPRPSDKQEYLLGTSKVLDGVVELPSGEYVFYLYVKDKENDRISDFKFYLTVTSFKDAGWCMICDVNGKTRVDMVSPVIDNRSIKEYIVTPDAIKGVDIVGTPKRIFAQSSHNAAKYFFYLVGDKGTYSIVGNGIGIDEGNNISYEFGKRPANFQMAEIQQTNAGQNPIQDNKRIIVDEDGNLHLKSYYIEGSVYDIRLNINPTYTPENGEEPYFKTAPWVGVRTIRMGGFLSGEIGTGVDHNIMLFDQTNKRFMSIPKSRIKPQVMAFEKTDLWPSAAINKRMIFGQNIGIDANDSRQLLYGLFTDETDVWIYGVAAVQKDQPNQQRCFKKLQSPQDLLHAKSWAFSPTYDRLYYTKGSSVYMVDFTNSYNNLTPIQILDFPGEEIVKLSFWTQMASYIILNFPWNASRNWLTIATNKGAGENPGILRSYEIPLLVDGTYTKKFEIGGIGKIVDFTFKELMTDK